jgi:hypothetical protein
MEIGYPVWKRPSSCGDAFEYTGFHDYVHKSHEPTSCGMAIMSVWIYSRSIYCRRSVRKMGLEPNWIQGWCLSCVQLNTHTITTP